MSASTPKADVGDISRHVGFGPKAGVAALIRSPCLTSRAPDVSDELISYYRERKAGEQVRSLRGSQPSIRHGPSCRATLQGERASRCCGAWKHTMTTPVPQCRAVRRS